MMFLSLRAHTGPDSVPGTNEDARTLLRSARVDVLICGDCRSPGWVDVAMLVVGREHLLRHQPHDVSSLRGRASSTRAGSSAAPRARCSRSRSSHRGSPARPTGALSGQVVIAGLHAAAVARSWCADRDDLTSSGVIAISPSTRRGRSSPRRWCLWFGIPFALHAARCYFTSERRRHRAAPRRPVGDEHSSAVLITGVDRLAQPLPAPADGGVPPRGVQLLGASRARKHLGHRAGAAAPPARCCSSSPTLPSPLIRTSSSFGQAQRSISYLGERHPLGLRFARSVSSRVVFDLRLPQIRQGGDGAPPRAASADGRGRSRVRWRARRQEAEDEPPLLAERPARAPQQHRAGRATQTMQIRFHQRLRRAP